VTAREAWQSLLAVVTFTAAITLPIAFADGAPIYLLDQGTAVLLGLWVVGLAVVFTLRRSGVADGVDTLFIAAHVGAFLVITLLPVVVGHAAIGFWALLLTAWLLAWLMVTRLSFLRPRNPTLAALMRLAVPLLFGAWLLFLWEAVVRGAGVERVILPPPSEIWVRLSNSVMILWLDFRQTFLKAVIAGYAIGSGVGFLVAIVADRIPFLKRGLLPVGNLVSALPIIGIAPIMVMWFGFDWQSKAAVVAVMTFFPMLVNAVAGLAASEVMERDLMRTYAANYWQALFKLRLPAALPFIFNALKINSTLAMIGAIVAEFFGTPIVGMGFRISTEVGRMNIDMVWAEIAVAALAGSAFYGAVTLIERAATFWHPSFRQS
jgi:NitT/TauT family transport system permease protein